MRLASALLLSFCLVHCGGSRQHSEPLSTPTPAPGAKAEAEAEAEAGTSARPPKLLWWQGEEPACKTGALKRRSLTWGSVYWCAVPGQRVDGNLQDDLGRLARCVKESISAFQEEPEEGKLGAFLARAEEAGLNPVLCRTVRRDSEARTYHGRTILVERRMEAEHPGESGGVEAELRYRFSCRDCLVAAETRVRVAL